MTTKSRTSIFDDAPALDISGFTPKTASAHPAPTPDELRAVSEAARFPSREAKPQPRPRTGRRLRTNRNVQLNIKAEQEVIDAFYAVADQQGWVLGEAFAHAVKALQEKLQITG